MIVQTYGLVKQTGRQQSNGAIVTHHLFQRYQIGGCSVFLPSLTQLVVQHEHGGAVRVNQFELLDDLAGVLFFFDLLRDEPLQRDLGGIVILFDGQFVKLVNQAGHFLLVFQDLRKGFERRLPFRRRLLNRLERHATAPVVDVVKESHGVRLLFLELHAHPMRKTLQVVRLKVSRHRKIQIGRVKLVLDLLVDRVFYGFADYVGFSFSLSDFGYGWLLEFGCARSICLLSLRVGPMVFLGYSTTDWRTKRKAQITEEAPDRYYRFHIATFEKFLQPDHYPRMGAHVQVVFPSSQVCG